MIVDEEAGGASEETFDGVVVYVEPVTVLAEEAQSGVFEEVLGLRTGA